MSFEVLGKVDLLRPSEHIAVVQGNVRLALARDKQGRGVKMLRRDLRRVEHDLILLSRLLFEVNPQFDGEGLHNFSSEAAFVDELAQLEVGIVAEEHAGELVDQHGLRALEPSDGSSNLLVVSLLENAHDSSPVVRR